jgi:hypothetical protein
MICPIKRRNGRMVVAVLVVGAMVAQPPKTAIDVALFGAGALVGLMVSDTITSGIGMPVVGGCGCRK